MRDIIFADSAIYIDHITNTYWDWKKLWKTAKDQASLIPIDDIDNKIVGISGENGIETLLGILSIFSNNGIPAPFPPGYQDNTYNQCMKHLGAVAWREGEKWKSLGNGLRHVDGFDLVVHSSGSTGTPKPLAISLSSMIKNSSDFSKAMQIDKNDIHIGVFSQCYMSGLYNQTLLPMFLGCKTIGIPTTTPKTLHILLDALSKHNPTVLWINPLIARSLANLRSIPETAFSSLRFAISCTAHLPELDKRLFEERFKIPLLQSYGLCETLINTVERCDSSTIKNTVGAPIGCKDDIIIDHNGQIVVENGAIFCGSLESIPTKPIKPFHNYATGDLGYFDSKGNLIITGRLSEVINRNGVKISPEHIEGVINRLPGVVESAVIGFENNIHGIRVVAWVVALKKDASVLHSELRSKLLAVEQPHEIRMINNLPRTANGKLNKPKLRQLYNC
jgi:acyl-coenzyme A synthetase/AMP-(fatty) acid ligase